MFVGVGHCNFVLFFGFFGLILPCNCGGVTESVEEWLSFEVGNLFSVTVPVVKARTFH